MDTTVDKDNINAIADWLSKAGKQTLSHAPWQDRYSCFVEVQFAIAFGNDSIYLQYDVVEPVVQAAYGKNNDPVHRDSCVETFISFDEGESY